MIRTIFFAMLSIIVLGSCSQKPETYIGYHKSIQKAEELICSLDYKQALAVYSKAFAQYPHAFYDDLHNACLCALKTNDYQAAYQYAKKLVLHGCELSYFDDDAFGSLRSNNDWKRFVKEYDGIRNKYLTGLNYDLREEYLKLYRIDQSDQRIGQSKRVADSIFYVNALKTVQLIKENGFPEWYINNDSINNTKVLFDHYCILYNQMNAKGNEEKYNDAFYSEIRDSKVFDTIRKHLREALENGFLTPQTYVGMVAFRDFTNPYGEMAILIDLNAEKVSPNYTQSEEEFIVINQRRDSIGLPPLSPETTQNYINSSWYRDYPFKQVKEALAECDGCPIPDFIIMANIEGEFSENYRKEGTEGFRLRSILGSSVTTMVNGL